MSRNYSRSTADENIKDKVRRMKEKQKQWMDERESAKQKQTKSNGLKNSLYLNSSISGSKRIEGKVTPTRSNSLTWISKDNYHSSSKKSIGNQQSDRKSISSKQFNNKRDNKSSPINEFNKSASSVTGFDDGFQKSTRTPSSPIRQPNAITNSMNNSNKGSFDSLADEVGEKLQLIEKERLLSKETDLSVNKNKKLMSNHICASCDNLMASAHLPMAIVPCGHTFCKVCATEFSKCPQCHTEVFSIAPNTVLQQIIEDFRKKQEKERLQQLEKQTRKYVEEYQNLNLRCEALGDEADIILNSMEEITESILKEKRVGRKLEKQNTDIKAKIKELELEHSNNEELLKESSSNCHILEKKYDSEKDKLALIEETIKTIRNSKERAKLMIQNLAPNLKLDDTF